MKKNLKSIIIVVICAILCLGYFYYLSNRNADKEEELSEVEMVISKDLEKSYPQTPREVVKFYNRILKCYYNEEYTEAQLEQLVDQVILLMDEELKEKNPREQFIANVKADIKAFQEEKKQMSGIQLAGTDDIEKKTIEGREYAYVQSSYYIKSEKSGARASQTYILRKDEDGNWKILGFYQ